MAERAKRITTLVNPVKIEASPSEDQLPQAQLAEFPLDSDAKYTMVSKLIDGQNKVVVIPLKTAEEPRTFSNFNEAQNWISANS